MRHLVQLLVPVLIFAGVIYFLTRGRRRQSARAREEDGQPGSDTGAFIVILLVSTAVAIATAFMLQAIWE
jgi:hypothetical protein